MRKKRVLILFAGRLGSVDYGPWQCLREQSGWDVDFAFSTWRDCSIPRDAACGRVVWTDLESEEDVVAGLQGVAGSLALCPAETRPLNTLTMWHKWNRFLALPTFSDYDAIIKTRPDVVLETAAIPRLVELLPALANERNRALAIPHGGDYRGGVNDVFAMGAPELMKTYLGLFPCAPAYYRQLDFIHPERILRYHLVNRHQIALLRFRLGLFLRGGLYNRDDYSVQDNAGFAPYMDTAPLPCTCLDDFRDIARRKGVRAAVGHGLRLSSGQLLSGRWHRAQSVATDHQS